MKTTKVFIAIVLIAGLVSLELTSLAQVTNKVNYQAVARNNLGAALQSQSVGIRLNIRNGSGGSVIYQESHIVTTNQFGLFTLEIGNGTPLTGTYNSITWSAGNYWLEVEMDPTGGTSYTSMGQSELLSVPYANYAASNDQWRSVGTDISNVNSGNVGIGTSSPSSKLHLVSPTAANGYTEGLFIENTNVAAGEAAITISNSAMPTGNRWAFGLNQSPSMALGYGSVFNNANTKMVIDTTGQVGIGANPPNAKLHVVNASSGASSNANAVIVAENNTSAYINILSPATNESGILFGNTTSAQDGGIIYNANGNSNSMRLRTNGNNTRMTIDSTGNVGIGNTAPSVKLQVDDGSTASLLGGGYILTNSTTAQNVVIDAFGMMARNNGAASDLRLNSLGGNVGIGTTAPTEALDVIGNINASADLYTGTGNGVINCGGGLMNSLINIIADVAPTPLQANGDEDLYIDDVLEVGGSAFKPGGGLWSAASDARLKKDVIPFSDGLSKILKVNPVAFHYNDKYKQLNNGKQYIGVIAQDLKAVAPYMVELKPFGQRVNEDKDGKETIIEAGEMYYTYDGSALIYIAVNAIKEQQKQIEDLRAEIEALKKSMRH